MVDPCYASVMGAFSIADMQRAVKQVGISQ